MSFAYVARQQPLSSRCVGTMADLKAGRIPPLTQKCLCGAARVGGWTSGVHHGAHTCARVITKA